MTCESLFYGLSFVYNEARVSTLWNVIFKFNVIDVIIFRIATEKLLFYKLQMVYIVGGEFVIVTIWLLI
ncbi:hypothetical protein TW78_10800 [Vibrio coralliilyticus]|uniref:Uncharacterized protein n=1 Tax=Vibrio coralliilyticus TaxID=190893 RepID=A0A837G7S5_9VIBR|nr:hypothetical protein TW78_10800 [Vibrio coralliilyticus]